MPQSVVLNHILLIATQLKWAWDYLLYQSFFQPYGIVLPEYVDDLSVTCYQNSAENGNTVECAVCLCKIDDGDEIRELSCNHLFHRVCLDRWLGYGHVTCPLCRNNLKPSRLAADSHQEVIAINFCATRSRDRCTLWLR
ncbi:RING/U-box superfamily protein [Abeliophyllum distichum]|uniref:RING/U-box superfamily protein n=1 Tax=Abeliophyllum distichum TaxID=126358 RepID=A0ABD1U2F0_9LAMI